MCHWGIEKKNTATREKWNKEVRVIGITFQKWLSLLFLPPLGCTLTQFHCSDPGNPGEMTSWEKGRQANKGEVLCLEEGTNHLHFSGLEGLRGKRRLDGRGGAMYLLSLLLCAKALEERSVLDTSREAKSRVGIFSTSYVRLEKGTT